MMTQEGAIALSQRLPGDAGPAAASSLPRLWMGHWDVALKEVLIQDGGGSLRASYIIPPIGYATHPSGIERSFGGPSGRPNCWGEAGADSALRNRAG